VTTADPGPRVRVLGSRFTVRDAGPAVAAELTRLLTAFADSGPDDGLSRPVVVPAGTTTDEALSLVLAEINTTALAEADLYAVHAGAVARGGRVVAMPAVSGTGKSTLTAACLRAGMEYVSDEALCLDWETGHVVPYPRPIALSPWSAAAIGLGRPGGSVEGTPPDAQPGEAGGCMKDTRADEPGGSVEDRQPDEPGGSVEDEQPEGPGGSVEDEQPAETLLTAADLGAATAGPPLTLAHVVLLDRAGTGTPVLERIPRSQAVAEVLRRSFTSWRRPDRAFDLVHEVLADTGTWRLSLGEPAKAAAVVADLLS
jgi:hypothetical protein